MRYRTDKTGFGEILLKQDTEGFCYGLDAVILADFVSKSLLGGEKVIELGTGNGIIPLILALKNNDINIVGVELQESAAELAEENVERNNLKERITIINKDIRNLSDEFWERFDVVCCNPPYFKKGTGMISENDAKMVARHETTADISDFLKYSEKLLVAEGELLMVHRPERLVDIFESARKIGLEPRQMRMIKPYIDKPANLVLVKMKKGRGRGLKIMSDMIVREKSGKYSEEILEIYEKSDKKILSFTKN